MLVASAPPIQTVAVAATRNGQSRATIARNCPPTIPCQRLVTNDGTSISAIAASSPSVAVSSARATVGRPSPITPLTVPAARKVTAMIRAVTISIRAFPLHAGLG